MKEQLSPKDGAGISFVCSIVNFNPTTVLDPCRYTTRERKHCESQTDNLVAEEKLRYKTSLLAYSRKPPGGESKY